MKGLKYPPLWMSNFELDKCIDTPMHHIFEGMIKTRGLDAMGKAGMHIAWNRSSVTNKKRKNILVSTVADKGVMTLMVQIYCSGCMRWVQIPFYSPKKLLHDEKLRGRADSNGEY